MTRKELFERHETMCEHCTNENCDGIHLTINNTTVCEQGEMKAPIPQEIDIETIQQDDIYLEYYENLDEYWKEIGVK